MCLNSCVSSPSNSTSSSRSMRFVMLPLHLCKATLTCSMSPQPQSLGIIYDFSWIVEARSASWKLEMTKNLCLQYTLQVYVHIYIHTYRYIHVCTLMGWIFETASQVSIIKPISQVGFSGISSLEPGYPNDAFVPKQSVAWHTIFELKCLMPRLQNDFIHHVVKILNMYQTNSDLALWV